MTISQWHIRLCILFAVLLAICAPQNGYATEKNQQGYIAREEGVKGIFDAISSIMRKPVILSKIAVRKKISGEFDITRPQGVLTAISDQLGLIWYNDGQAIYVYDASEIRNAVIVLRNTSFSVVSDFLQNSGLYDTRYPLRSDQRNSTFYVSGPPIYIELISNAAKYLDQKSDGYDGRENIAVIPLYNTFVEDREYNYRNDKIIIPGISTVVNRVMSNGMSSGGRIQNTKKKLVENEDMGPDDFSDSGDGGGAGYIQMIDGQVRTPLTRNGMSIISDPGTNSLLVRGSAEQVEYIRNLVSSLDKKKRHIELSVWIVDLQKEAFENLGVEWTGNLNVGSNLGFSFNGGSSTIDGASFMVTALALSEKKLANIVSRPMLLTQENIPAIFDNSRTFYSKLVGERTAQLDSVTYGTLVSVLPRFTANGEVEMMLNVEDGNQFDNVQVKEGDLPEVGRTNISTVARVPRGKSLLIGGYTRDEDTRVEGKIPLLGDLPWVGKLFRYSRDRSSNMVRVFLIQPREIEAPLSPDASTLVGEMKNDFASDKLQNWMMNYLDSQKWR
ncbi:type III secretion system outer membrane ring subunit SctC [Erwinia tasmaniensis]|uniref:type III secretion system outer membrane ring subunit SctC n=1 Tax=Erwinia tasmaniensis TaxID=338565 RepID=UPI003A4E1E61